MIPFIVRITIIIIDINPGTPYGTYMSHVFFLHLLHEYNKKKKKKNTLANFTLGSFVHIPKKSYAIHPFFVSHLAILFNQLQNLWNCGIMGYFDRTKILIKSKERLKKIYYCELYSIVYGEITFLNDNQYFCAYLYWGKCPLGHIRPPCKIITQIFFKFFLNFCILFFHFRCILLKISHKKCFFISISIFGRSGMLAANKQ